MKQKQKRPYYFVKLHLNRLSKFRKHAFELILLVSLLIGIYSPSVAQNRTLSSSNNTDNRISGVVTNAKGEMLSGVSVTNKGTSVGTATDATGKFSILAKRNDILVFTYVSHVSQEITVNNQSTINVILSESSASLNDVVVVGYGTQKKSIVTGAISSVKAGDIDNQQIVRIEQALQGRTSGVTILIHDIKLPLLM